MNKQTHTIISVMAARRDKKIIRFIEDLIEKEEDFKTIQDLIKKGERE